MNPLIGNGSAIKPCCWAAFLELVLIPDYPDFLLVILPPVGFLILGFLLAGKRLIDRVLDEHKSSVVAKTPANSSV